MHLLYHYEKILERRCEHIFTIYGLHILFFRHNTKEDLHEAFIKPTRFDYQRTYRNP